MPCLKNEPFNVSYTSIKSKKKYSFDLRLNILSILFSHQVEWIESTHRVSIRKLLAGPNHSLLLKNNPIYRQHFSETVSSHRWNPPYLTTEIKTYPARARKMRTQHPPPSPLQHPTSVTRSLHGERKGRGKEGKWRQAEKKNRAVGCLVKGLVDSACKQVLEGKKIWEKGLFL